ncbi:MAG: ATP-binding protein [Bacteroidota bacterium]
MDFSSVRWQVVLRVLFILACGFASGYFLWFTPYSLLSMWLALAVVLQTAALIRLVERGRQEMSDFLLNLRQRDFTPSYTRSGRQEDSLHQAFETINQVFLNLNAEKEQQARYLQTVVEHVEVALLSYNGEEEVALYNAAAQRLFRKQYVRLLSALDQVDQGLYENIRGLVAGDQRLVKFMVAGELQYLAVRATEFKVQEEHYTLVSFSDIRSELEAQEVESWQKLIRVLTHEIMNSAIPITTLTDVTYSMLFTPEGEPRPLSSLDEEEQEDLLGGLETIARRSKGLVSFMNAYRDLNQVPEPKLKPFSVRLLLEGVSRLMQPEFDGEGTKLEVELPAPEVTALGDQELLEQVLINIVGNAREAVEAVESALVEVSVEKDQDRIRIHVLDNGPGIAEEHLDKIFIPFFTTKATGSGIGLALSRQIMRLHKGSLTVATHTGTGTKFTLEL